MNSRKEKIWEAARDGNKKTISRLLPQATAEDLLYEAKNEVIVIYWFFYFYSPYSLYIYVLIILFLLQHKLYTRCCVIQVNLKMPALIVAAYNGHLDIVQMLLQSKKVDVNQKCSKVSIQNLYYH